MYNALCKHNEEHLAHHQLGVLPLPLPLPQLSAAADNCEWLAGQIPAVKAAARSQEVSQMPVGSVLSYIKMLTG